MKIGRQDRDMLRFEDGIGDRMGMGQIIISSSYQLPINNIYLL